MRPGSLQRRRSYDSDRMIMGWSRTLVTFLDKTINDHFLCLVASIKQQIYVERSQTWNGKLEKWPTPKRERIRTMMAPPSLSCDAKIKIYQSIINHDLSRKSCFIEPLCLCLVLHFKTVLKSSFQKAYMTSTLLKLIFKLFRYLFKCENVSTRTKIHVRRRMSS